MDFSTLALIHRIAVTFYIGYYGLKVFMVLANRKEQLAIFKKKTLVLEITLPLVFIATGVMMIMNGSAAFELAKGWFHLKMTLLVAGIVTGIIGIKKFNKVLVLISIICFLAMYGHTEMTKGKIKRGEYNTETTTEPTIKATVEDENIDAEALFSKYCVTCHGEDGKKGLGGAADLSMSVIDKEATIEIITNGQGNMAAYSNDLTADQINKVAEYVLTFR